MASDRISLVKAFVYAAEGIAYAFKTGRNFKIECAFGIAAIALGFICSIDTTQWALVVVCIGVVLGLETLNTAMESVVDLVSPDFHELAKRAKDCAAGAVLFCAFASAVVACFIFLPPLVNMVFN